MGSRDSATCLRASSPAWAEWFPRKLLGVKVLRWVKWILTIAKQLPPRWSACFFCPDKVLNVIEEGAPRKQED